VGKLRICKSTGGEGVFAEGWEGKEGETFSLGISLFSLAIYDLVTWTLLPLTFDVKRFPSPLFEGQMWHLTFQIIGLLQFTFPEIHFFSTSSLLNPRCGRGWLAIFHGSVQEDPKKFGDGGRMGARVRRRDKVPFGLPTGLSPWMNSREKQLLYDQS
jgi:hypothetical protein